MRAHSPPTAIPPRGPSRRWLWAAAIVLHLLPFATRPALIGGDEPHYALMAHSLAVDGDFRLADDYAEVEEGSKAAGVKRAGEVLDRHLRDLDGREVFSHPVGLPLLAAPVLALHHLVAPGAPPDIVLGLLTLAVTFAGFAAGRHLLQRFAGPVDGDLLAFGLYFSTPLWYYSRTFFTEPYIWSFAVLAIAALSTGRFWAASLALGLVLLMKESALLVAAPILGYVFFRHGPRRAFQLALGPAAAVVFFLLKNQALYSRFWVTFQPYVVGDVAEGAWRVLLDSRHGLFLFAPVLVLALVGWVKRDLLQQPWKQAAAWALAAFGGLYLLTAAWVDWAGGSCYGPRLLLPAIPAFAWPLVELWRGGHDRRALRWAFYALVVAGFTLQFSAATDPVGAFWSASVAELLAEPWRAAVGLLLGFGAIRMLTRRTV